MRSDHSNDSSFWLQNDFFLSAKHIDAFICQWGRLFMVFFSLQVWNTGLNFVTISNENKCIVFYGSITFDLLQLLCSPSVLCAWPNTLVCPAPITYYGDRRWEEGGGGILRQWKQILAASSDSAQPCCEQPTVEPRFYQAVQFSSVRFGTDFWALPLSKAVNSILKKWAVLCCFFQLWFGGNSLLWFVGIHWIAFL